MEIDLTKYDTDKSQDYLNIYEDFFSPLKNMPVKLLELGVDNGGSLLLWRDYFVNGTIIGLDKKPVIVPDNTDRIRIYQGLQQDIELLDRIRTETAPRGFDIIIDDASHIAEMTKTSFWHLFRKHLKSGGIYAIEDWGTGYWDIWPDGSRYEKLKNKKNFIYSISSKAILKHFVARALCKNKSLSFLKRNLVKRFPSHEYGMVGFVKQLIDECGIDNATHQKFGHPPARQSIFLKMQVSKGQVIIVKK